MSIQERKARENILEAATAMIRESGSVGKVTIREVAARAGVGIGLVNYYYGSKQNLVRDCVRRMISSVVEKFAAIYGRLDVSAIDKIRYLAKSTGTFFVFNPGVSRVAILMDLEDGSDNDNTAEMIRVYEELIAQHVGGESETQQSYLMAHGLLAALQSAYLRRDVMLQRTGLDFYDDVQRETLIDQLVDGLFSSEDCSRP